MGKVSFDDNIMRITVDVAHEDLQEEKTKLQTQRAELVKHTINPDDPDRAAIAVDQIAVVDSKIQQINDYIANNF